MNNSPNSIGELVGLISQKYHSLIEESKTKTKGIKTKIFNRVIAEMQGLYGEKLDVRSIRQMKLWYNHFRNLKTNTQPTNKDRNQKKSGNVVQAILF
jgi:hypothetical protein